MKELSTNYCELYDPADGHGNLHNTNWIVIREDDPAFAKLAERWPDAVRDVEDASLYGAGTAYDFNGPV